MYPPGAEGQIREPASNEHVERFLRIYGAEAVEITPVIDAGFRNTIAAGNHARMLLDSDHAAEDPAVLRRVADDSAEAIEEVMSIANPALVERVQRMWSAVPVNENKKSSGLLNTLCEARTMFHQVLQEVDGTEEDGQTISGALQETAARVEEWLTTPGRYVMRRRRIKAKILTQEEVEGVYTTLGSLETGSNAWLAERGKLLESVHRLCRHIALERFLMQGRLPNVVSIDDLANEATEYVAGRALAYNPDRGIKFSSWIAKFLDHYYSRRLRELADPIHVPQQHKDILLSTDPAQQLGVAKVINERPDGLTHMHQAWLALGRNILRLDGEDGPSDSDQFVTDPEGGEQNIGWQELLSDHHRLIPNDDNNSELWSEPGRADTLQEPATFAEASSLRRALEKAMNELIQDERTRRILVLRYGLDDGPPLTLEEVGEYVNLTGERVRQIHAKAIAILQRRIVEDKDSPYYGHFDGFETHESYALRHYDPHKGQPDFPEYVVGEAASEEVLEEVAHARRARSGAVDPSLWEW